MHHLLAERRGQQAVHLQRTVVSVVVEQHAKVCHLSGMFDQPGPAGRVVNAAGSSYEQWRNPTDSGSADRLPGSVT